ncbi:MAG TPA: crosslink repair DNA glycosylase YcaQ family protein [Acidimicrobiia bacterium]
MTRRGADTVSARDARRLAVRAQGLATPRPARATTRHLREAIDRIGVLQLDAINVVERTQLLVLFSRVGAYDVARFHAMTGPQGELLECSAHAASLVPMERQPLLRWRQDLAAAYGDSPTYAPRWEAFHRANAGYLDAVMAEIAQRGALAASQLSDPRRQQGEWWDRRSHGRRALEFLFLRGELAAWRTPSFERVYDLPERVIPPDVLAAPTPTREDAERALLLLATRSLGVATVRDLASYYMMKPRVAAARVDDLVEQGDLVSIEVEGWAERAYARPGAAPRARDRSHATLLSPFDSLIWDRKRTRRVFGFDYRIEVYVPGPKREHGYYVLPLLLGDELVARFDLKADRRASSLRVVAAHAEPGVDAPRVAGSAAVELDVLRAWLGLDSIAVARRGDLARDLARAVSPARAARRPSPGGSAAARRGGSR